MGCWGWVVGVGRRLLVQGGVDLLDTVKDLMDTVKDRLAAGNGGGACNSAGSERAAHRHASASQS